MAHILSFFFGNPHRLCEVFLKLYLTDNILNDLPDELIYVLGNHQFLSIEKNGQFFNLVL